MEPTNTVHADVPTEKPLEIQQKDDAKIGDSETTGSRLLDLPSELRMKIYEFALVKPWDLHVMLGLKEPRLLSTNRQIREEARAMWYNENTFHFDVHDCDDNLMYRFVKHARSLGVHPKTKCTIDDSKNWANLQEWCFPIWTGVSGKISSKHSDEMSDVATVIRAAHDIVWSHRMALRDDRECLAALDGLKRVVQKLDPEWK